MATLLVAAFVKGTALEMALLTFAAGIIDQMLFGPPDQHGPRLGEQKMQISTYGTRIPTVFGTIRIAGNVIWATKYVEHSHKEGGKGGPSYFTYTYTCSFAIGLAEGELLQINRVWADGKLITPTYTFYTGSETQEPDPVIESYEGIGNAPAYRGLSYVVFEDFELEDYGNRIPQLNFECVRFKTKLCNVIKEIVTAADIDESDIAFTLFDDFDVAVPGYAITQVGTHRAALEPLQSVYFFDVAETRGLVRCIRRGHGESVTVDADDLAAHEGEAVPDRVESKRKQEMELPQRLIVSFLNRNNDYQTASVEAKRIITQATGATTVNIPIALATAEAMELAEKMLYELWGGRMSRSLVLPTRYAYVNPGNLLNLALDGKTIQALVLKTSFGKPGLVKVQAVDTGATFYSAVTRTADADLTQDATSEPTAVLLELIDTNLLTDDSVPYRPYAATWADVFYGTTVFVSNDGGASYALLDELTESAIMGIANTALAAGPVDYYDMAGTVEVFARGGTLASVEEAALLNGANACLIGTEILQYKTAELIGEDTYRLSHLLRGRRGTDGEVGTHAIGDSFVALTSGAITQLPISQSSILLTRPYKYGPSTLAADAELYSTVNYRHTGKAYLPYSVAHPAGARDGSGNLTISWLRRTRIGGAWNDYADVPLSEDSEAYELDVMNGGSVVRTLASGSESVEYTAEEQTTDFGSAQAQVAVRIYQLSATRGRGYVKEATV